MKRTLKAFGLLLVAALAISAMTASASQAAEYTAGAYPATLDATSTGDTFSAFGQSVKCESTKFDGELTKASETLSITPTYEKCTAESIIGKLPVTVTHNGCTYRFNKPAGSKDNYTATTDVICPAGKVIEVHIYLNAGAHAEGNSLCTLTIPPQTGLIGAKFEITTKAINDVDVTGTLNNITAVQHRNSFLCPAGTHTATASYAIAAAGVTVQGTNSKKELVSADIG